MSLYIADLPQNFLVLVLFPKPKYWTPGGYSMGLSAVVIPDILR